MIRPDPFEACISKWSRQPTVVADDGQADDLADPWRTRQRDLLLSMGVG